MAENIGGLLRVGVSLAAGATQQILAAKPGYHACLYAFEGSHTGTLIVASTAGAVVHWDQRAQTTVPPTTINIPGLEFFGNPFAWARAAKGLNLEIITSGAGSNANGVAIVGYEVAEKSP